MKVAIEYNNLLSYVTYINRTPIIQTLSLFNDGENPMENISVVIQWDDLFVEEWSQSDISLEPEQSLKLNFQKKPLRVIGKEFVSLTEGYMTSFTVTVKSDDELLYEERFDVNILTYNQWLGINYHPTLISSFVTPNHPQVIGIIKNASEILSNWKLSFSDYQTQDKNDVRAQIKAIYIAIQKEKIHYITSPPNFEDYGQRIRLADDVIVNKMGNCIELAVLFASCLEYVRLNPLIILMHGHAFVGCWLEDHTFQSSIDDDVTLLTKRLSKGIQTIELVESTLLTSEHPINYEEAVERAQDQVIHSNQFEYILDVSKSRSLGVKPLPQKIDLLSIGEEKPIDSAQLSTENSFQVLMPEAIEDVEDIEIITKRKRSRLKVWESKLLNLTLRNTLLNFRPTRRSISILEGDLNLLEDNLSSGSEFSLVPCPTEIESEKRKNKEYSYMRSLKDEYRNYMNSEMKSKRLVTLLNEDDLDYAIKALYYTARTELEENGANTLFVAMGFLKWYESDVSKQARYAPILMYPIEMVRKSSAKGYVIRYRDEEVQINTTLLEKLRMELNLEFPGLNPLPIDDHGIDVKKVLNTMRSAIMDKRGWDVIDVSYIGLFSFNQFVMWNDIHSRSEELMNNQIVGSLMQGKLEFDTENIINVNDIDDSDLFSKNAILMDADSSQLSAIYSASNGSSFVLHGPPGTGKSQTITNIIASALYNGKSVLFVAEKMAALNVVESRLDKLGIGDFALELHSNKTKKSDVLNRIGKILEKRNNGEIKEIQEKRLKLYQLRNEIKETNSALHRIGQNGYSIYEMISIYESQYVDEIYSIGDVALKLTKNMVERIVDSTDRYLLAYGDVAPILTNSLNFINTPSMTLKERDNLKNEIISLKNNLNDFQEKVKGINMKIPNDANFISVKQLIELLYSVVNTKDLVWHYLHRWNQEDIDDSVYDIIAKGCKRADIEVKLLKEFSPSILKFDSATSSLIWNQSIQKWFIPKLLDQNKVLKTLKVYSNTPKNLKRENVKAILDILCEYVALGDDINSYMSIHCSKFEELWKGDMTDWDRFESSLQATQNTMILLRELKKVNSWFEIQSWAEELHKEWMLYKDNNRESVEKAFTSMQTMISNMGVIDSLSNGPIFPETKTIGEMREIAKGVFSSYDGVDKWVTYVKVRNEFKDLELYDFIQRTESGELDSKALKPVLIKSLMYYGAIEILEKESSLSTFDNRSFEYLLEQYKQELTVVTEMTRLELIERLTESIPKPIGNINMNSELGILKKAVKSSGRGLSLRKLFDMTPNVLHRIAPCMLMSPISIAQYIDPSFPKFDLVIFDEASQVHTHAAIGAIARGKQLIVVGDPNQLPPTSFFSGNFDDEDMEFEETDQDSILDECQAIMFQELYLKWHYRSSHESLIAFSNSQYYDNKLYTFPSYNDLESKVRLIQVEGYYDRGSTKQNAAEADAIIEEVKRRLKAISLRKQSIGIVTFSSVQQKLIQNKLDELFAHYPKLEEYAQELKEEIFVKNLENVQGDERDVILFSIGYGPDQNGKVTMNFGPLNHSEGWKRLNVVVSRSREEMIVYSTLKPEQIDLSRTSSIGLLGLKRFLEFAREKNSLMIDYYNTNLRKDEMIDAIAAKMEEYGYSAIKNVGKSDYRIDIGVINPELKNEFIAAIIIDGKQYNATPTVRDKVIVQPAMLKRLKWNVINVWSLDWFRNQNTVMEDVKNRIEAFKSDLDSEKSGLQENENVDDFEFEIEYINPAEHEKVYYERYDLGANQYPKESFYDDTSIPIMSDIMDKIIKFEAPIVEDDLFRRIISTWGISQIGSRVLEILKLAASGISSFRVLDDYKNTYWKSREEYEAGAICRRFKDEKRKFHHICDDEIEATILEVLSEQISLDSINLCREVFKIHGYNMLGADAQNNVLGCLSILVNDNEVIEEDERYILSKKR